MTRAAKPAFVHPFDQQFGTETSGLIPGKVIQRGTEAKLEELTAYYGIAPSILHTLLDFWLTRTQPQAEIERTVFLDVGAGKGRAVMLASQYPFLRVEGVELNPRLARLAQANIERFLAHPASEALAPISLHEADATRYPLPSGACIAFLFHPFELPVLKRFVAHVERSLTRDPHPFDLFYVNTEHDAWLDRHPAFARVWFGSVPMSAADHVADLSEIAQQKEYGSTGDELCAIYRYTGREKQPGSRAPGKTSPDPRRKTPGRR